MKPRKIYPDCARTHVLTFNHSRIAMKHYCLAKAELEQIKEKKYDFEARENFCAMSEHIDVVCVFSAMAIEAYFNDYAAACLGDSEFYDNFDRLSTISKFQLIAKFILNVELDKSKAYYSHLKALIKERDSLVHGKSTAFVYDSDLYVRRDGNSDIPELPGVDADEVHKDFKRAQNAIKALRDIAEFFDSIDYNASAKFKLLNCSYLSAKTKDYVALIIKDFHIAGDFK